jgi:hypothetical protein
MFWVCVCSLSYPACKWHNFCAVLCRHMWPARLYSIIRHHLVNNISFGKKVLDIRCVLWFYPQIFSENFLILRQTQLDSIINVQKSSCKVPVIIVKFKKEINFLDRFSRNAQLSNFENSYNGIPVVPCGWTRGWADGHDKPNGRFSQFCKPA